MLRRALPEYLRIKHDLIADIESGRRPIGSPLPSESQLTAQHNVSRATVVRSLQELALEGFVYRQKGRGSFVADFKRKEDRKLPIPLFIYEGTCRMSGSGRQVLLRIMSGIEDALGSSHPGINVRQVPAKFDDATRRFIDETRPGVALLIEPSFNVELVEYLRSRGCTTWVINEPTDTSDCCYVNQERAGYLATSFLLEQGCVRIALLNGPVDAFWGFKARYNGYAAALRDAGSPLDPKLHRQGQHGIDSEAGRAMFRSLMDEHVDVDGIVGASDSKAMGAMAAAEERGLVIGRDLSFVSIDDTIADQSDPPLSSVAMPFEEMGRQVALKALEIEQRNSSEAGRREKISLLQQICLQPYLVRRSASAQKIAATAATTKNQLPRADAQHLLGVEE